MSPTVRHDLLQTRRLLVADGTDAGPAWPADLRGFFRRAGVVVCHARCGAEAVERVEQGGLMAAVLVEGASESAGIDVLSLVRIIRSIDQILPCWLVTNQTSRRTLERALDLRVNSIIHYPRRVLTDPFQSN